MTYTMSDKRKLRDRSQADWERRLEIFRLHNQGLNFSEIGRRLGTSRQNVQEIYTKISKMTLQEVIDMYDKIGA